MLVPVQTSGNKPPLFFVHGLHGVMPLGLTFARVLGPDQPLYGVNADGIDGQRPAADTMREMIPAYVEEIQEARPAGPIVVGGMCDGGWAAIEIARELRERGRNVGPVILADPPVLARSYAKRNVADRPGPYASDNPAAIETARKLNEKARQAGVVIPAAEEATAEVAMGKLDPEIERQLYKRVYDQLLAYASLPYNSMPFDATDSRQLHVATLAGMGSLLALSRHLPAPFWGPAQLILSDRRALGFFHRQMPWHELLPGPRMVHVLPGHHIDLFGAGRHHVARAIKFMLEQAQRLETLAEQRTEPPAPMIAAFDATPGELASGQA